jgi:hypothetical protein
MYRFTKDFERDGIKIAPGVVIDRNLVVNEDCVSVAGSNIFNDIPLEYLENFEPVKYKKTRTQSDKKLKVKENKTSAAASARISSIKESLRLCEDECGLTGLDTHEEIG